MVPANFRQRSNERQLRHIGSHRASLVVVLLVLVLAFELMSMALQDGVFHGAFLVVSQQVRVDHVVQSQFGDVVQIACGHV